MEEQAIERVQIHKAEIASLKELIETLELEMEEDDVINPDYVEDLENTIKGYKEQVAKLEEDFISLKILVIARLCLRFLPHLMKK